MRMRKTLLIAVLLGTTALTAPTPARAGPVIPFIQGVVMGIAGTAPLSAIPWLGGSFGVGASIGVAIAGFLGTTLGSLLFSIGTSALLQSLTSLPKPSQQLTTFAQPSAPMEFGYGEVRKAGAFGLRSGFKDDVTHRVITIAAHPTEGPVSHWLDLRQVQVNDAGDVATEPYMRDGFVNLSAGDYTNGQHQLTSGQSFVNLRTYTGGAGQQVDPILEYYVSGVTSAHDFKGHSYAAISLRRAGGKSGEVYSQGQGSQYAPVWRMWNEIRDPRDESIGYSNNWALCFAHWLTAVRGFEVNWDHVAFEANVADEVVTNAEGGQQARWTFNHVFNYGQDFAEILPHFLGPANGFIFEQQDGKLGFYSGYWQEPEITLTDADFLSLSVQRGNYGLSPITEYVGEYREPANNYLETPSGAVVVDDSAKRNTKVVELLGSSSHNQTTRVLKQLAAADRAEFQLDGQVGLIGYEIAAGRDGRPHRFVRVESEMLGVSFDAELVRLEGSPDGVTFRIELASVQKEDFDFVAATDEPTRPALNNAAIAESDPVPEILGLAAQAVQGAGGVAQIEWTWPEAPTGYSPSLRLRESGGTWQAFNLVEGETRYVQTAQDGASVEGQIRATSTGNRVSAYKPDTPLTIVAVANTSPPSSVANFLTSQSGGDVTLTWDAPEDANYYAVRIFRADYSAGYAGPFDVADASLIRTEYGLPAASDSYVDQAAPSGESAWWIVPINASGISGPTSGPEVETLP